MRRRGPTRNDTVPQSKLAHLPAQPGECYEAFKRDALTAAGTSIATKRSAENK
jgi:hypothetical protein